MILKKRCIIRKRDVMEAAHLEQTQMLIIHSTPVEETGEKDGVHVETHQLRGGLIQADQTDTHCNCNHLEDIFHQIPQQQKLSLHANTQAGKALDSIIRWSDSHDKLERLETHKIYASDGKRRILFIVYSFCS